ncbi:MAG: hypothetical protein NZ608_05495 [candidate division WOR-3 bacterium]|nr:hypothetical protein [candidate division WOR-3 bacterium]
MYQIEGTNKLINQFLKKLDIPYKSDTIYIFIVPPMTAARIEVGINPFISHLRNQGIKNDIILLAVSNKKRATEKYLQRRRFEADYQRIVNEEFLKFFHFSAGILEVPFVTKFSFSEGELLSSLSLMGKIDSSTVSAFIADLSKPKIKRKISRLIKARIKGEKYKPIFIKKLKLYDTEEYPISKTFYINVSPSENYLALCDNLSYRIYIFDLKTGKLLNLLYPDSTEERMFVNVSDNIYIMLKNMNLFNPMYFNCQFLDDTTILVAASLPKIQVDTSEGEPNIGYYNVRCFIKKEIFSNKVLKCIQFQQPSLEKISYLIRHTDASIIPQTELIFAPFSKGWPMGSEMLEESKISPYENPFTDEFYKEHLYQFAVYNFEGKFIRFLGSLNKQFEKLKMGYFLSDGLVKFYYPYYYTTDRYSGKIYIYNQNFNLLDSIILFENFPIITPTISYLKDPVDYLVEAFKNNFKRRIVDFLIWNEFCYALINEEEQPVIYKINLKRKDKRKILLPIQIKKEKVNYYILRATEDGVVISALLENFEETFYSELRLP